MYLRHSVRRKDGKTHTYWRLVRSVRRGSKVAQETVAQLGELDSEGRTKAEALAFQMTGRTVHQRELFEENLSPAPVVAVRLDGVRLERPRAFGDVWLGWTLWRGLRLDALAETVLPPGREAVPWAAVAAIHAIARLCEPSSDLHIAEDWYRKTALDDILGVSAEQLDDDRLYRALDRLLPHKATFEQHLKARYGELFALDYDLLLYDVTSTYFEGEAAGNPQAKRGHSRDHRPDCKQVCIALVVTKQGMPLGYEVFDGNRTDVTTVEEIVSTMERRFGKADRVWVMDRGMASEANIAWFWQTNRRYLMGTPKAELKKWHQQLLEERDWRTVREGLEVKLCTRGKETFVLCRSEDRRKKEQAMHEKFAARIEDSLQRLQRRLNGRKKKEEGSRVERQIGRLLQRNSRAAGRFTIEVKEDATAPCGFRLSWTTSRQWDQSVIHTEGCYILRTNISDWTAESLWQAYIQLTEAEAAFRIQKSELSIRPIWHHKKERVQAHIFVCFLAYAMWKALEKWQERAGLGNSPRTILDELHRLESADVVLPLADRPNRELRLRCVVRPDPSVAYLLQRLGLRLPDRLRRHDLINATNAQSHQM